jgi:hypothetical protein
LALLLAVFCGCVATLVLQYRTRRAWWARAALVAVALIAAELPSFEHRQSLVDAAYADSGAPPPLAVAYAPDSRYHVGGREFQDKTYIDVPIQYSPQQGDAVSVDDFRFTLTAANGTQWTSPWQGTDDRIMLQPRFVYLSLSLSPETFDRFNGGPVMLKIEFGISRYENGATTRLTFPSGDAAIPGVGFCAPQTDFEGRIQGSPMLRCRSVIDDMPLIYATATTSNVACGESPLPGQSEAKAIGGAWVRNRWGAAGLSPVEHFSLFFGSAGTPDGSRWYLCPGAAMTVTPYHLADRGRASITIPNFQFPPRSKT